MVYVCDSCGEPITGIVWRHSRLNVLLHGRDECMRNVQGEDVRRHTMILVADRTGYVLPDPPPRDDSPSTR